MKDRLTVVMNDSETKEDNGRCELFFIMLCHAVLLHQERTGMLQDGKLACDTRLSINCDIFRDVEIALECKPYHISMKRDETNCTTFTWTRVRCTYTIVLQDKRKEPNREDMEHLFQTARELANISKRRVRRMDNLGNIETHAW